MYPHTPAWLRGGHIFALKVVRKGTYITSPLIPDCRDEEISIVSGGNEFGRIIIEAGCSTAHKTVTFCPNCIRPVSYWEKTILPNSKIEVILMSGPDFSRLDSSLPDDHLFSCGRAFSWHVPLVVIGGSHGNSWFSNWSNLESWKFASWLLKMNFNFCITLARRWNSSAHRTRLGISV